MRPLHNLKKRVNVIAYAGSKQRAKLRGITTPASSDHWLPIASLSARALCRGLDTLTHSPLNCNSKRRSSLSPRPTHKNMGPRRVNSDFNASHGIFEPTLPNLGMIVAPITALRVENLRQPSTFALAGAGWTLPVSRGDRFLLFLHPFPIKTSFPHVSSDHGPATERRATRLLLFAGRVVPLTPTPAIKFMQYGMTQAPYASADLRLAPRGCVKCLPNPAWPPVTLLPPCLSGREKASEPRSNPCPGYASFLVDTAVEELKKLQSLGIAAYILFWHHPTQTRKTLSVHTPTMRKTRSAAHSKTAKDAGITMLAITGPVLLRIHIAWPLRPAHRCRKC